MESPTKSEKNDQFSYICIHCGSPVRELYKKYSPSVLKIMNCKSCDEIADKYIEFEPMIIAIDVVLLTIPAYKHLLYNSKFKGHWKLFVVILLLEAYILWIEKSKAISDDSNFTFEKLFYLCFGLVLMENFILFILLRLSLIVTIKTSPRELTSYNESEFLLNLVKSMTIANISKFFLIPILIWKNHTSEVGSRLNYALVMGYFVLALTHVYSVVSNRRRCFSAMVIVFILIVKMIVFETVSNYLEDMFLGI